MNRYHLLAAEIYGYSFANYEDHLGIGHLRYEKLMPDDARALEQAEKENWPIEKIARALDVDLEQASTSLRAFRRAREVVDAGNAAESFRCAVRQVIESVMNKGLRGESVVEQLVIQICYRAADLAFLLDREGKPLSAYSEQLRREVWTDVDNWPSDV